MTMSLKPNKK